MAQTADRGEAIHALRSLEPFGTPRLDAREGGSEYRFGGKGEHDVSRWDGDVSVLTGPELRWLGIEMMNLVPSGLYLLRLRSGSCKGKNVSPIHFLVSSLAAHFHHFSVSECSVIEACRR